MRPTLRSGVMLVAALVLFSGGCTRYEFDVLQPADQRVHVGTKESAVVHIDPLDYRLRAAEGRLVIQIRNNTSQPIRLDGERSTVVDIEGESHPLRTQTIASRSFIKLILPPLRPRFQTSGPTFGVGVGISASRSHGHRHHVHPGHDVFLDQPKYLTVYDESDAYYWDMKGQGTIRLNLIYQQGQDSFEHKIELERRKVK